MSDVFNNSANNYVNPNLSPCAGDGEQSNLEFVDGGIGIVAGSEILAKIDFSDLSIPVNSWNQQNKVLQPGEVTFIQGLTKGLKQRQQAFNFPSLVSSNPDINQFFMIIDLSINFYKNFSYVQQDVDASSNYTLNLDIADALNIEFHNKQINVTSSYDPSALRFVGNSAGYEYNITNVILTLIDASMDENSPFAPLIIDGERIDQTYVLMEDGSASIPSANYPNSASQGVILKATYPNTSTKNCNCPDGTICPCAKWIYIGHSTDYVTVCEPIELNFNSEVSTNLTIVFDGSTYLGDKPIINIDVSIADVSIGTDFNILDVSITADSSVDIISEVSTNTILEYVNVYNSIITDSSTISSYYQDSSLSNITFGSPTNGVIDTSIYGSIIIDTSIINTVIIESDLSTTHVQENSVIIDSSITNSYIKETTIILDNSNNTVSNTYFLGEGDPSLSYSTFNGGILLNDNYIKYYELFNISEDSSGTLYSTSSIIRDISVSDLTYIGFNSSINDSYIGNVNTQNDVITNTIIDNLFSSISTILNSTIMDSSISLTIIEGSNIKTVAEDSSLINSTVSGIIEDSVIVDSSIINAILEETHFTNSTIYDVSINQSIINNSSKVGDPSIKTTIINSWANVLVLVVNPSTNEKIYIMEDDTTPVDSAAWNVEITNTEIWDSSLNNTTIYDSSIYRGYIQDSSLIGCTLYNVEIDGSSYVDSRTIMIDASISCAYDIINDTSTFYRKVNKKLEVGMSGCSTEDIISAGDYLNYLTQNDLWKKVGDMYAWTTAPDSGNCGNDKNLIDGFYLYNPQLFDVMVEYLVFV